MHMFINVNQQVGEVGKDRAFEPSCDFLFKFAHCRAFADNQKSQKMSLKICKKDYYNGKKISLGQLIFINVNPPPPPTWGLTFDMCINIIIVFF